MRVRVKICCISSIAEARLAINYSADALGLVSTMPSGPGVISEAMIKDIAAYIPPPISSFLLTCAQTAEGIISQARRAGTNTIQLVDELPEGAYQQVKEALPFVKLVQVIHVTGEESIGEAKKVSNYVDAILLDSGNPKATVKILGGIGKPHDWEISKALVEAVTIPVFLAGGLNASNVSEAIATVQPFGVDICSGVRTNSRLDEFKLRAFMEAEKKFN